MSARLALLALAPAGPKNVSGFIVTPAVQRLVHRALAEKTPKGGRWLPAIYSSHKGTILHLQVWPKHRAYPGVTLYLDELAIQIAIYRNDAFAEGGRIDVDPHDAERLIFI
jgi:hypothetical protein